LEFFCFLYNRGGIIASIITLLFFRDRLIFTLSVTLSRATSPSKEGEARIMKWIEYALRHHLIRQLR